MGKCGEAERFVTSFFRSFGDAFLFSTQDVAKVRKNEKTQERTHQRMNEIPK